MNVDKALRFVFEDDQWVSKLLVGSVISLIPFFGSVAITGYAIAVLRNARAGSSRPLPAWDRLGEYFVDGLMFWVALLIYAIPLFVLLCPIAVAWFAPIAAEEGSDAGTILASIAAVISAGLGCLATLYALFLWVLAPVLQIRYAEAGKLGACLRFRETFRFLFANLGALIVVQVLVWAAGLVVTAVLGVVIGAFGLVPLCGWVIASLLGFVFIPVGVWLTLFASHLYAGIDREASRQALVG